MDVMPIYMIILRYSHNYSLFYQVLDSNLFTHHNTYAILREITSETYGPGGYFHHISFRSILFCNLYFQSISQKYQKYFSYYHYLYQISLLKVAVKGLTTPLSRWLRGSYLFVAGMRDLRVASYWIDTSVLKN